MFATKGDAGIFIDDNEWGRIGDYVVCPECVRRISSGEVALTFEEKGEVKMSKKKRETVSDIVAEMRVVAREHGFEQSDWADRIEAAFNRLPLFTSEQLTAIAQQGCENFDLKRENARLRAALKPVLECSPCWSSIGCSRALAVSEAKRIYNGNEQRKGDKMKDETKETQEPSLDAATVISIARHYHNAKTKHPYFADLLFDFGDFNGYERAEKARFLLEYDREKLKDEIAYNTVRASTVAKVEAREVIEALARGDRAQAVAECYDVIAVMLRIIDVIEGRQALGRPKTAESEAK